MDMDLNIRFMQSFNNWLVTLHLGALKSVDGYVGYHPLRVKDAIALGVFGLCPITSAL